MIQLATIVDWEALLDTAIASIVAGVVVTVATVMAFKEVRRARLGRSFA